MTEIFFEVGIVIVAAMLLAGITRLLRQPIIIAYIAAGILIGPMLSGLISNTDFIRGISELGIVFLLFMVGIEMDYRKLKDLGSAVLVTGVVQVALRFVLGFIIATLLGFDYLTSGYIAIALSFGSTMVVIKLLSDARKLETLHGRSVLGILLIEDVIAILVLTLLPNIDNPSLVLLGGSLLKGLLLFSVTLLSAKLLLPRISRFLAASSELLLLGALAWLFLITMLAAWLEYSVAIGAFLAGLTLASLRYSPEIRGRVKPLRDFFATLFFVALGMQIRFLNPTDSLLVILFLPVVVLFTPIVNMVLLSLFGYPKRAAFLTGTSLGQVSEFSLIVVTLGVTLGHITESVFSLVAVLLVITVVFTSYEIKHDERFYQLLSRPLSILEKLGGKKRIIDYLPRKKGFDVLLCGHNRMGYSILKALKRMGKRTLVVDYNPDTIRMLAGKKMPCIYGDINNAELLDELHLDQIQLLISTIPELQANRLLIEEVRKINKKAVIMTTADLVRDAFRLYRAGSDYVIMPHMIGGEHVSHLLRESKQDFASLKRRKQEHLAELKARARESKQN